MPGCRRARSVYAEGDLVFAVRVRPGRYPEPERSGLFKIEGLVPYGHMGDVVPYMVCRVSILLRPVCGGAPIRTSRLGQIVHPKPCTVAICWAPDYDGWDFCHPEDVEEI